MVTDLQVELDQLSDRARQLANRYKSYVTTVSNHTVLPNEDWKQHGLASAYLAFIDCGGDPDHAADFDWHGPAVLKRTLQLIRGCTLGAESDFIDVQQRQATRRGGALNDTLCWDTWYSSCDSSELAFISPNSPSTFVTAAVNGDVNDRVQAKCDTDRMIWALAKVLRPQEVVWLVRRYRDGVPRTVLIDELVTREPRYQVPKGRERATTYVDVTLHRARERARKALGAQWAQLAQCAA